MTSHVSFIWDIDGVIVDSPHEEAWRITAMKKPWSVKNLSTDFYFDHVASKPRYEGGNNILKLKGVYERLNATTEHEQKKLLHEFCEEKNELIRNLISEGKFKLFPDAIPLLLKARDCGILQAAASASKNAKTMLLQVPRTRIIAEFGNDFAALNECETLYNVFDVDVCGLDVNNKAETQKIGADKLNKLAGGKIKKFVVFEDAPSGIEAAKSLGYTAIGILRIGTENALYEAGSDIVVQDLRKIKIEELITHIHKEKL